jgi:hypothetical protein
MKPLPKVAAPPPKRRPKVNVTARKTEFCRCWRYPIALRRRSLKGYRAGAGQRQDRNLLRPAHSGDVSRLAPDRNIRFGFAIRRDLFKAVCLGRRLAPLHCEDVVEGAHPSILILSANWDLLGVAFGAMSIRSAERWSRA